MSARGPAPVIPASVARLDLDVVVETLGRHAVNVRIRDPQRPLHVETGQADWVLPLLAWAAADDTPRSPGGVFGGLNDMDATHPRPDPTHSPPRATRAKN